MKTAMRKLSCPTKPWRSWILKLFLVVMLVSKAGVSCGQWVTIPDANFASYLQQFYPTCMNGNLMDTTCSDIINLNSIAIYKNNTIQNLDGIQYFDSLDSLQTNDTTINLIPVLPPGLLYLRIKKCFLTTLPSLPNTLQKLDCWKNNLTSLPPLPSSLTYLDVREGNLSSLPVLPSALTYLVIKQNNILSLPALPSSLIYLDCSENLLTSIPALPSTLLYFYCDYNYVLANLPALPSSLKSLKSSNCSLSILPVLPQQLEILKVENNFLTSIPTLPVTLISLSISHNQVSNLPALNCPLTYLDCLYNLLVAIPPLPTTLDYFGCNNNQLVSLPNLPTGLTFLRCANNQLTSLPSLPDSLSSLDCNNNQLLTLPFLPDSLAYLKCDSNQLSCLPVLPNALSYPGSLSFLGNNISCLPNYVPAMNGTGYLNLPLCADNDSINNPNACLGFRGVGGFVYFDKNSNCILDTTDVFSKNVPIKLFDSTSAFTGIFSSLTNGVYNFVLDSATYTLVVDTMNKPYKVNCAYPGIDSTVTLTTATPAINNVNFNIECKPGFDLGVKSVVVSNLVFPGLKHKVSISAGDMSKWYNLNCANGESGGITVIFNGPVTFDSVPINAFVPLLINGNTIFYGVPNFGSDTLKKIELWFTTNTTAQAGDNICFSVNVTLKPADTDTTNNNYTFCYLVTNSSDPNDKQVYPDTVVPPFNNYFTYTIRFQNTGTAPAQNVRIVDTLDSNLDLSTFEIINYSHENTSTLTNNIATFRFPAIQLPDSTMDAEGSKGFIQYRIKPIANLPLGTQINNTAYIYFDYNAPVTTNNAATNFTTSVSDIQPPTSSLHIFPNPGKGMYHLQFAKENHTTKIIEVLNALGEKIYSTSTKNIFETINLTSQPNGIYILRVIGDTNAVTQKIVKQ